MGLPTKYTTSTDVYINLNISEWERSHSIIRPTANIAGIYKMKLNLRILLKSLRNEAKK